MRRDEAQSSLCQFVSYRSAKPKQHEQKDAQVALIMVVARVGLYRIAAPRHERRRTNESRAACHLFQSMDRDNYSSIE